MFRPVRLGAYFLSLVFLFTSCAHYSLNKKYSGPKDIPDEVLKYYSYEKTSLKYSSRIIKEKEKYTIKRIEITSPFLGPVYSTMAAPKESVIIIDYYDIKGDKKTPVILVLPILGGNNKIANFFSSYFADHGLACLIVHRDEKQKDEVNLYNLEAFLRQMDADHKAAIDWISTQKDLDPGNIGVFGVSMGGIKAALLTALDPRIKASVIALAGGDIPYILLYTKEKGIRKRVSKIMDDIGLSKEDLYNLLSSKIMTDPIKYAEYIDARKVLMVLGVFDKVVPYKKGRELARAIGGPEEIDLLAGHYTSILYIFYIERASLDFFERKLK